MKKRKKTFFQQMIWIGILGMILLTGCNDGSIAFLEAELAKETSKERVIEQETSDEEKAKLTEQEIFTEMEQEASNAVEVGFSEQMVGVATAEQTNRVYVHVCGAVKNPGVYEMTEGSRIFQALEAAGGIREDAAGEYVNQAMTVTDGQQIYIPTQQEIEDLTLDETLLVGKEGETSGENAEQTADDGKVNINTADAAALMTISGIGEARAKDIIAYREANGGFSTIEEIMNVPGIKEATFEKIKDGIKVK